MANAKIIAYVEARNAQQNAINDAKNSVIINEAHRANARLNEGIAGALAAAAVAEDATDPMAALRIDEPPPHGAPNPINLQEQFDWLYAKTAKLAEAVIALIEGHASIMARPKDGGGSPS